jgi:hypothetical protein
MILGLLVEFMVELLRALLVDELSGRVRKRIRRSSTERGGYNIRRALLGVHHRNRDRLLHRLRTEEEQQL